MIQLFGFQIGRIKKPGEDDKNKSFALPTPEDGAVVIQSGSYFGTFVDLDGIVRNEIELITRYREMSIQPELETAIDEIVNEAIVVEDSGHSMEINLDSLKGCPDAIKTKIKEEFATIIKLLNFGNMGHEIFRRWYIDGRLFYHVMIDETNTSKGIQEIRYIDPRRIRKIREIQKGKDALTGMEIIRKQNEYYLYNERGIIGAHSNLGAKIAVDSVVNVNSGLMDAKRSMVLSYTHKAIKPLNNLRMMEDASVIYRMSRAPERRIFYIDVGNMPTIKAEQYLKDVMTNYKNKLVYNSEDGTIKDDRRHLSMLEDFWLPRREGGKGTEIATLPGGQNLGVMEDVQYFEKKLYKSLGVPISRLEPQQGFSLGRTTEITRDELKFTKFVQRLRNKFSTLFDDLLRVQLILKKVCTDEEWKDFKEYIWYDFKKDNNFNELKETELLNNRLATLQAITPFVGIYYSEDWVRKHVCHLDDQEIEEIAGENEQKQAVIDQQNAQMGLPPGMPGQPPGMPPPQRGMPGQQPPGQQQQKQPMPMQQQAALPPPPSKFEVRTKELEFAR